MANEHSLFPGTAILRQQMAKAGIASFRALAQAAGVSSGAIHQLRQGQIGQMRVKGLRAIAAALHLSLEELIAAFEPEPGAGTSKRDRPDVLAQEYARLQQQHQTQAATLRQALQQEVLSHLEPWLLQWPTVTHAVAQNPDLPASRLLPLVKPVEQLLAAWDVVVMAPVGTTVPYDPQCHQLMTGEAHPGDAVRIRYVGYRWGDRLLHRAKVSPIDTPPPSAP